MAVAMRLERVDRSSSAMAIEACDTSNRISFDTVTILKLNAQAMKTSIAGSARRLLNSLIQRRRTFGIDACMSGLLLRQQYDEDKFGILRMAYYGIDYISGEPTRFLCDVQPLPAS
jgi:hypothetical protein